MRIYVVALMVEGKEYQDRELFNALAAGDWFPSEMAALATMDQWNHHLLEATAPVQYERAEFHLLGVFTFAFEDLAGTYDN